MQGFILGAIIVTVIAYIIFTRRTKRLYVSIDKLISKESNSITIKQSLDQIRNIIQAQFKNVISTEKTVFFEYKNYSFIVAPLNISEVLISLAPSEEEIEIFEQQEQELNANLEEDDFANDFLFKTEVNSISNLAKSYVHIGLITSYYVMENGQVLHVNSETQTIKEIIYDEEEFSNVFTSINKVLDNTSVNYKESYSDLGFNGYILGLAIAGGIVQPLNCYPANGVYILMINRLSFKITFFESENIEYELIKDDESEIYNEDEIPF